MPRQCALALGFGDGAASIRSATTHAQTAMSRAFPLGALSRERFGVATLEANDRFPHGHPDLTARCARMLHPCEAILRSARARKEGFDPCEATNSAPFRRH